MVLGTVRQKNYEKRSCVWKEECPRRLSSCPSDILVNVIFEISHLFVAE